MPAQRVTLERVSRLLAFWAIPSFEVHDTYLIHDVREGTGLQSDENMDALTNLILSNPRGRSFLARQVCQKFHVPSLSEKSEDWARMDEDMAHIIFMSSTQLEQEVCTSVGCVILSHRIRDALNGDEVRTFIEVLGEKLFASLRMYGVIRFNPHLLPANVLVPLKPENFLEEAKVMGLTYLLGASALLEWPVALRFMLKLRTLTGLLGGTRDITFQLREKKRVWSFIVRVWKEVGQPCFAS